jgi:transposase InsO family protein
LSALTQGGLRITPLTQTAKAREVVKNLLRKIITIYGFPLSIISDNGPDSVAEIVQGLAKILKVKWTLHTVYRSQSSEKVECMNINFKITLAKLCQETQSPWIDVIPLALLRACCTSRHSGYLSFEILYSKPHPIINRLRGDLRQIRNLDMSWHLQALGKEKPYTTSPGES